MTATLDGHAPQIAERILALFNGRDDVLAVPHRNGEGFEPERLSSPLTVERFVKQHLGGAGCLGFYLLRTDNRVVCSCVDFDNKRENPDPLWKEKASKVYRYLEGAGLSPVLEISQSGNAAHVWVFFSEPVEAWTVRQFWAGISKRLGVTFVEVYPRQDELTGKGLGNLIRYPLFNQSRFVDVADWSALDPIEALDGARPLDPDEFVSVCRNLGFKLEKPAPATASDFSNETGEPSAAGLSKRIVDLLSKPGKLKDRWGGDVDGLNDQSRSGLVESIATILVRSYVPTGEIAAAIRHWCESTGYKKGLRPDWIKRTVEHAYEFVASKAEPESEPAAGEQVEFERLSSRELADASHETPCIVDEVVPEAQGGVIGGRFKVLKTGVACDLVVSAATGTSFLNHFAVPQAVRVGMMSAEIGARSLKERAAAVAAARGFELRDLDNAIWSTASPRIGEPKQMEALERFIVDDELAMLVIDPSYLAFSGVGDSASNVFKMGGFLIEITRLIERTGCAILLVNHNRKGRGQDVGKFDPPEMAELAMSGFAEWLRFYLLLGPRQEWDETGGNHWLWLRTGGSAIDSGLWGLDVHEGRRSDPGGRVWDVELSGVTNTKKEQQRQAENRKAEQQERKEAEHQRKLEAALLAFPEGETGKVLREASGLNGNNFAAAVRALINSGKAAACTVTKRGQSFDGYRPNA